MEKGLYGDEESGQGKSKISVIQDRSRSRKQVLINGDIYMSYGANDKETERMAIAQLFETGKGEQAEISEAFRVHINSVKNCVNRYRAEGYKGLVTRRRGPAGAWKITASTRSKILWVVFDKATTNCTEIKKLVKEIFREEISEKSIRHVLLENGLIEGIGMDDNERYIQGELEFDGQMELPFTYATDEVKVKEERDSGIKDAEDTIDDEATGQTIELEVETDVYFKREKLLYYSGMERQYLGRLEQGEHNSYGAGLLLVPMLKKYRFVEMIRETFPGINTHEGYGLEQLALVLFYFSLFGYRSIEDFKTAYPEEFGVLIGRTSSPSIYTLRRFLHKVRRLKRGEELMYRFGENHLRLGLVKWGKLYIDDHFLPYYGGGEITKGYYTVRDRAFPGSYNFMAVDEDYNPLIFMIRESSEDLIKKIPELIEGAKKIAKAAGIEQEQINKLAVIFDRGGYSAELFRGLDEGGIVFITWAKNIGKWAYEIQEGKFDRAMKVGYTIQRSKQIKYYEEEKNVARYGKLRAIILQWIKDDSRGVIYTNDRQRGADEILQIMCTRWGEENFLKAMKLDYKFDYMPGYVTEQIEEQPLVKNPVVEELKQNRRNLRIKSNEYKVEFAEKILKEVDKGSKEINLEQIKQEKLKLLADIAGVNSRIELMNQEIARLPEKITYDEAYGEKLVRFDYEKKSILDCIKTFSYLMEKKACEILTREHIPPKEVWTVLEMILKRGAEIKLEQGVLRVRIKRFRDEAIAYAARHLCVRMNEMKPCTLDKYKIPLHYEVS